MSVYGFLADVPDNRATRLARSLLSEQAEGVDTAEDSDDSDDDSPLSVWTILSIVVAVFFIFGGGTAYGVRANQCCSRNRTSPQGSASQPGQ